MFAYAAKLKKPEIALFVIRWMLGNYQRTDPKGKFHDTVRGLSESL